MLTQSALFNQKSEIYARCLNSFENVQTQHSGRAGMFKHISVCTNKFIRTAALGWAAVNTYSQILQPVDVGYVLPVVWRNAALPCTPCCYACVTPCRASLWPALLRTRSTDVQRRQILLAARGILLQICNCAIYTIRIHTAGSVGMNKTRARIGMNVTNMHASVRLLHRVRQRNRLVG